MAEGEIAVRFVTRESEDQHREEARRIYRFLVALFDEAGIKQSPNYGRAMKTIYDTIRDGVVLVAERDGAIIGSIGMTHGPFWYADEDLFSELWFFIRPEHRDGRALELIAAEIAALCDETGSYAELRVNNYFRRRVPRTRLERLGEIICFSPSGVAFEIAPKTDTP